MNFTDCYIVWPTSLTLPLQICVKTYIPTCTCERQGTMEKEITCISGHEFYTGSIWSRPLTYNLGLKSLQILYQTALCMESICKIQNEPGRWMERNYSSDKNFTQVCNYDQNHNRCDKHKKNVNFLKEQCILKNTHTHTQKYKNLPKICYGPNWIFIFIAVSIYEASKFWGIALNY